MRKKSELLDWRRQCERQLTRSIKDRLDFGFVYTYKPVLDDAKIRVFDSMKEYKRWSSKKLPVWLGYGRKKARTRF